MQAFWDKADCQPIGCWIWKWGRMGAGYGWFRGETAHRVAWELSNRRRIPHGLVVRHSCDNKLCVNPAHLLLGTHRDNMWDKVRRGRHGMAKLSPDQVRAIRREYAAGARQCDLVRRYGAGASTISEIVRFKKWLAVA